MIKKRICLATPIYENINRFGLFPFRSPLLRKCLPRKSRPCFLFLRLLRCFTSAGMLMPQKRHIILVCSIRFPHSEIPGSKVATHLPETYRSYATSFIAFSSQGIHHTPLFRPDKKCFIVPNFLIVKEHGCYSQPGCKQKFFVYIQIVNISFYF